MVIFLAARAGGKLVFAAGAGEAAVKAGNNAGQLVKKPQKSREAKAAANRILPRPAAGMPKTAGSL